MTFRFSYKHNSMGNVDGFASISCSVMEATKDDVKIMSLSTFAGDIPLTILNENELNNAKLKALAHAQTRNHE